MKTVLSLLTTTILTLFKINLNFDYQIENLIQLNTYD